MESLFQDVRYGIRVLLKNPGFTLVAVLTLALGIGANTSIFSLINAVMLKMLPVADPEQLVVVGDPTEVNSRSMGDPSVSMFSHPLFKDLRAGNQVFSGLLASGAAHNVRVNVGGTEIPGALPVLVSGNYFSVLGVNPILGRVLTLDDDTVPGASPVAVVSHQFWIDKLARNPNVVGQTININRNPFTIVGVAPPDFFGDTVGENQDIWIPITMQQQVIGGRAWLENYNASWLHCIGRLKPGVNIEQVRANLNVVLQQQVSGPLGAKLNKSDLGNLRKAKIQVSAGGGGFSELRGSFHEPLMLMMAIVGLVLVIACVNVANLLLARATARQKEIAVRLAIGAAPGRIIRQLLTESILLALAGGIVGVLIAQWATKGLLTLSGNPDLHASPDIRVLLFAAAVCLITGILFGLIPA